MKTIFTYCIILALAICGASCTHKNHNDYPVAGDYLVIGHPGGFVNTPLITYYLIANTHLTKDTAVPYGAVPDDISKFNFNAPGTTAQYDSVKNLPSSIPSELLSRNNQNIGQLVPDMGYYDVRASVNGAVYKWSFEGDQSGSSAAIQQFVTQAETLFR